MWSFRNTVFSATIAILTVSIVSVNAVRVGGGSNRRPQGNKKADQQASASWNSWDVDSNFFSAQQDILQTHPTRGGGSVGYRSSLSGGLKHKHEDFRTSPTSELRRNPSLSAPEDCARACREGEPPRICYYHFTLEHYTVLGAACQVCTPNATNHLAATCQCILADGVERGMLAVNRMLPGPSIQVCEGDKVVIDVENHIEGNEITIHWHGVWQRGTQYYDGVPFVTQCPIQEGNAFRYQWIAGNAGTHFWHAHTGLQKLDGIYGSLVIRQPPNRDPNSHLYDFDLTTHVILLSDWMHEGAAERFPGRLAVNTGQDPENVLINGKGQFRDPNTGFMTNTPLETFTMTPGKRYRFRMINSLASVCPAQLTFQGHTLTLIATDGEPVHPVNVNTIISFSGERYDFVINADQPVGAYWIQFRGLGECGIRRVQQLAVLRYYKGPYTPFTQAPTYDFGIPQGVVMNPLDAICNVTRADAVCVNQLKNAREVDRALLVEKPNVKIFLPFRFHVYTPQDLFNPNTYNRHLVAPNGDHVISLIDEISHMSPPAPLLSQYDEIDPEQFCNGDNRPPNCGPNCMCTHKIDIPLNAIVEVVLVDEVQQPNLSHPFHLHGYAFNVVGIGRSPDQNVKKINLKHALDLDRRGLLSRHFDLPPGKDTIAVPNNGYVIFRFRADNPGFWLFHCHFLFHIVIGMNLILQVGTLGDIPPVPPNFPTCGDHKPPILLDTNVV
ncbi:uncharacterized protein stw isoform X1 [Euwallacea similis]|uniref:uncharacterized protein stw isoform X1 n=1 Tax=Euwallacea similis TaxID=1736056 RepID=UPI00344DD661